MTKLSENPALRALAASIPARVAQHYGRIAGGRAVQAKRRAARLAGVRNDGHAIRPIRNA